MNGRPLRHCMIVYAEYPHAETRVERQALALVEAGAAVDVLCLRTPDELARARVDGVEVHRLPLARRHGGPVRQMADYLAFLALASVWTALDRRRRFDVVQVHNLPDFLVFAAWLPRRRGARVLLDLHDLMPEFFLSRFGRGGAGMAAARLLLLQERWATRFADHVVTVTDRWRSTLVDRGVPADKVSVVMNAPDTRVFRAGDAERRAERPDFHVLYHGTVAHRYGVDLAVRAVGELRGRVAGLRVTVHGTGDALDDCRRLVREQDLGSVVAFSEGHLSTADMAALVRTADLALVPYRRDVFTDGILPTKLMEYVASEVPVVATRTPAIEAYFDDTMVTFVEEGPPGTDGVDALVAAVAAAAHDRDRVEGMARRARSALDRHGWDRGGAADYVGLVRSLADAPPRGQERT